MITIIRRFFGTSLKNKPNIASVFNFGIIADSYLSPQTNVIHCKRALPEDLYKMSPKEISELSENLITDYNIKGSLLSGDVYKIPSFLYDENADIPKHLNNEYAFAIAKMALLKSSISRQLPVIAICDGAYYVSSLLTSSSLTINNGYNKNPPYDDIAINDGNWLKQEINRRHPNNPTIVREVPSYHSLNCEIEESQTTDVKILATNIDDGSPSIFCLEPRGRVLASFDHIESSKKTKIVDDNANAIDKAKVWEIICDNFMEKMPQTELPSSSCCPITSFKMNERILRILDSKSLSELSQDVFVISGR